MTFSCYLTFVVITLLLVAMHCSVVTDTRLDDLLRSNINLSDYRAALNAGRSSRDKGVRMSVRLSNQ